MIRFLAGNYILHFFLVTIERIKKVITKVFCCCTYWSNKDTVFFQIFYCYHEELKRCVKCNIRGIANKNIFSGQKTYSPHLRCHKDLVPFFPMPLCNATRYYEGTLKTFVGACSKQYQISKMKLFGKIVIRLNLF